jgi:hypothetical protein
VVEELAETEVELVVTDSELVVGGIGLVFATELIV